jgi:hypothetical protein
MVITASEHFCNVVHNQAFVGYAEQKHSVRRFAQSCDSWVILFVRLNRLDETLIVTA